ncbi:MAG TPA: MFS transporter [Vicinamibacterales bacterium]
MSGTQGDDAVVDTDPRDILATSPMSQLQWVVVALTVALNALDGYDVLSISFASPGIATEWGINRAALGIVLSMELIGMAIGSVVLGNVADRIGRRPTVLGCLVVMAGGMLGATTVTSITSLSIWRVLTGLGIGGMLAACNAVAAEFANARRKHLAVSLMSIGYPVGAVLGGSVAAVLLQSRDWRSVFYFGAGVTAALIPVVALVMPESPHWLARKQPDGALERINAALRRMGHKAAAALPSLGHAERSGTAADIFGPALFATTVTITLAYFLHITTFYFILKWTPKIVVDMGFAASSAASVLVWTNVGGATGGAVLGILTQRFTLVPLTVATLLLSSVMVTLFGRSPADLQQLSLYSFGAGFFVNAGIVGLYAIIAQAFPTQVRASGTGFTIGVGRGGSVIAPIIAGFLFNAGYGLPATAMALSVGSLLGAGMLLLLKLDAGGTAEAARLGPPASAPSRS